MNISEYNMETESKIVSLFQLGSYPISKYHIISST